MVFRDLRVAPQELQPNPQRRQPTLPVVVQRAAIPLYNQLSISTPERPPTPTARTEAHTHYVRFLPHRAETPMDLVGMSLRQAQHMLEKRGYRVFWQGNGPYVTAVELRRDKEVFLRLEHEKPS